MSGVLNYDQNLLMIILKIAGLVSQKGEGHVVKPSEWVAIFNEYNLTNEISRNSVVGLFDSKPTYYLRIGRKEPHFTLKDQMNVSSIPPRILKLKVSRIMSGIAHRF